MLGALRRQMEDEKGVAVENFPIFQRENHRFCEGFHSGTVPYWANFAIVSRGTIFNLV
jgi:hypothetical protein